MQSWGDYGNIQSELGTRQLVVSLVQAMNRIRCRRVIDAEGNCDPCDIYLILPHGKRGDEILSHLTKEMNGINVVDWAFQLEDAKSRKPRKSAVVDDVLDFLCTAPAGNYKLRNVRSELGIAKGSFGKIKERFTKPSAEMRKQLKGMNVSVCIEATTGRRQQITFVKDLSTEQLRAA